MRRTQPDLVHILDGSHAYLAALLPRHLPVVVTVHDLIPLLTQRGEIPGPRPSLPARVLWRLSVRGLRRCRRIMADSQCTAADLQRVARIASDRLAVVHLPVCDPGAGNGPTAANRAVPGAAGDGGTQPRWEARSVAALRTAGDRGRHSGRPVILHVGNNAAYKNREGVLHIVALVAREAPIPLVMAGPPPSSALRQLAADLDLVDSVEWRCDVSDSELQALYRQAAVFLFPSHYEGFGWPPLEAMARGCPVVCSNAASLPEVVADAALTAAPTDHSRLARHCLDLLRRPGLRDDLVRRGFANLERFTLRRFEEELAAAYAAALGRRG